MTIAIWDLVSSLWHDTTIQFECYPMPASLLMREYELLDDHPTQVYLNKLDQFLLISQLLRRKLF